MFTPNSACWMACAVYPQLVKRAKELGMNSLAITDHGAMYGAIDFYQAAKAKGIKPIIGCEFYVAPKPALRTLGCDKSSYHVVLLARKINRLPQSDAAHLQSPTGGVLL